MLDRIRLGVRSIVRRRTLEREMNDEMQQHLERATERLVRRGMTARDASATARREFGNVEFLKEQGRDARGARWLHETVSDVRYGTRGLLRTPGFTAVALTSLTLGIGLNTALFTVLMAAFNPSTADDPPTLVDARVHWSYPTFAHVREAVPALDDVFARSTERLALIGAASTDEPTRVTAELVTAEFFVAMRARPLLGRVFTRDESVTPGREPVAVLSHRLWRSRYGEDSSVIGRPLRLADGSTFTIIGVMPQRFTGADRHTPDLWIPLTMRSVLPAVSQVAPRSHDWFSDANTGWIRIGGRLRSGFALGTVHTQIEIALRQLTDTSRSNESALSSLQHDDVTTADGSGISGSEWLPVSLVALATFAVLLIACANVTNLMLARAAARRREIAVRQCLGASRGRLVRQLLVESAVLAIVGGVGAVAVVAVALRIVAISGVLAPVASGDSDLIARTLAPNASVFFAALSLSLVSAVAIGLIPALRTTDDALMGAVKSDSGAFGQRLSRSRLRSGLVIAQVSLSLVLLLSAGLLLRSSTRALTVDVGFERQRVLVVSLDLGLAGYDAASAQDFDRAFRSALSTIPGVRSVARGGMPVTQRSRVTITPFATGAGSGVASRGHVALAEPGYFETLGIPVASGRAFTDEDIRTGAQVAIVTQATARSLWPNENPLGRAVAISATGKLAATPEATLPNARVVGVVRDAQMVELGKTPNAFVFVPGGGDLLVRVAGDATVVRQGVRDLVRSMNPNVIANIESVANVIAAEDDAVLGARLAAGFALAVGLLALALAATGLFGVVAYAVSQRTRELGIRVALGARPSEVQTLVVRQGMQLVAIGGAIGIVGGAAASRVLGALLFGMSPLDPSAYGAAAGVLGAAALLACYLPARRATRVDPLIALRAE